jgi:hypothetical protein
MAKKESVHQQSSIIKSILILAGAFTFAILLSELVHDSGHYFSLLLYGNAWVKVHFDPFGGMRIMGTGELPANILGVTSLAGPIPNLILAVTIFLILWRWNRPILLPFLLWGPIALIQKGVTFSLGLLTPGGDAFWISRLGIPPLIILIFGILLLIGGIFVLAKLLPLAGVYKKDPFLRRLAIISLGMCSLMIVRLVYSLVAMPQYAIENAVPLVFSLILSVIVVLIQSANPGFLIGIKIRDYYALDWGATPFSLVLGVMMFSLHIFL